LVRSLFNPTLKDGPIPNIEKLSNLEIYLLLENADVKFISEGIPLNAYTVRPSLPEAVKYTKVVMNGEIVENEETINELSEKLFKLSDKYGKETEMMSFDWKIKKVQDLTLYHLHPLEI